jgi:hypothetical protein
MREAHLFRIARVLAFTVRQGHQEAALLELLLQAGSLQAALIAQLARWLLSLLLLSANAFAAPGLLQRLERP